MITSKNSIDINNYINNLPIDRQEPIIKLHDLILKNMPNGFEACISYGMLGYVVPFSIYPSGYHCNKTLPLPFMALASQKNFIAIYNMGMYANPNILNWFTNAYPLHSKAKLDMGKSCIRFKKIDQIPYNLIAQLCNKFTVQAWIDVYEKLYKPKK